MTDNDQPKSVSETAALALAPIAKDFAASSGGKDASLSTGEALAGVGNVVANRLYNVVAGLDTLLTFKTYVSGWKYVEENFIPKVGERLALVPPEDRIPPPLSAAGLILEAAKYTADEPPLADLFANLLAGTMDRTKVSFFHPGYVEVIKQMTSDEARIIKYMGDEKLEAAVIDMLSQAFNASDGYFVSVENFTFIGRDAGLPLSPEIQRQVISLCRLGLAEIPYGLFLVNPAAYEELENAPELTESKKKITDSGRTVRYERRLFRLTRFGRDFYRACCKSVTAEAAKGA